MGIGSSYELPGIQLQSLATPVVAIDPRFAREKLLTLRHKENPSDLTVSFRNVQTGAMQFTLKQTKHSKQLTLYASDNVAVANSLTKKLELTPRYHVRIGSELDGDAAFVINARYRSKLKSEVHVTFTDRKTGEPCELGFEGNWHTRTAYFWVARGNQGSVREPVAKVCCPSSNSRTVYTVEVAPHMDAALIALVCAILDEQEGRTNGSHVIRRSLLVTSSRHAASSAAGVLVSDEVWLEHESLLATISQLQTERDAALRDFEFTSSQLEHVQSELADDATTRDLRV